MLPTTSGACVLRGRSIRAPAETAGRLHRTARATPATPPDRDAWDKAGKQSRHSARRSAEFRRCRSCIALRPAWRIRQCAGPTRRARASRLSPATSRLGWTRTAVAVGAGLGGAMVKPSAPAAISRTPATPNIRRSRSIHALPGQRLQDQSRRRSAHSQPPAQS